MDKRNRARYYENYGNSGGNVRMMRGGRTTSEARNQESRSGCCNQGSETDCMTLMRRIRAVDFAIQETVLYLDAYPCDRKALEYYHKLTEAREELVEAYQNGCGPLTNRGNESATEWNWICSPWPWEYDANRD